MEFWQIIVTVAGMVTGISGMIVGIVGATRNRRMDDRAGAAEMADLKACSSLTNVRLEEVLLKIDRLQESYRDVSVDIEGLKSTCSAQRRAHDELVQRVHALEQKVSG